MKKETLRALKAVSRKENRIPPPRIEKNKKAYKRHAKHKTGFNENSGLFLYRVKSLLSHQLLSHPRC